MKTFLTLKMTLGLFTLMSCRPSEEEKANLETQQKVWEDSIIKATEEKVIQILEKQKAFEDSVKNASENIYKEAATTNQNIDLPKLVQEQDKRTKEWIETENNIQRQLNNMHNSWQQQLQNYRLF